MSLSRLDLDDCGSPRRLAARIHELAPDLALDFDIQALCRQLDIVDFQWIDTQAFVAALVMDENKAAGSILLSSYSGPKRQRFSIGHELGHFLISSHQPRTGEKFSCSREDLKLADAAQLDRHKRIEAEANRFAAELLMPASKLRPRFKSSEPDLSDVVRLANEFAVSKEAMVRRYVEAHPATAAVVILQRDRVQAIYRPDDFPWIDVNIGQTVPADSIARSHGLDPGTITELEECDPETWLGDYATKSVEVLCEQVLAQRQDYSTVLLHAELAE